VLKTKKQKILAIFEDPKSSHFGLVNDTLAAATIVSIVAIVLETVPALEKYTFYFLLIEWLTVILFTTEYISRLWASKSRASYAFSFFGLVDLVAILPTLLGLGNLAFLKSARIIRIIRFLRLVRLAKLSRIDTKDAEETLGVFGFNVAIYAVILLFLMLIFGVILHIFGTGQYWSIPEAMLWTLVVFMGGLPFTVPEGTFGMTLVVLAKFCGMALFGLLIGVVGKIFNEFVLGKGKKKSG